VFDHVTIRVSDRAASERFYSTVLSALGIEASRAEAHIIEWDDFSIVASDAEHPSTRRLHLAFVAPSREQVDAFWHAGVEAGYPDDGPPGIRPQYRSDYYGAFLRDPDGNSAEAVHHGDTRRGGHIDHLWIRVRDLDAAAKFYAAVARHTGLREGRRWGEGRQFRGAWATFSLVHDGTPPTEHLHMPSLRRTDRQSRSSTRQPPPPATAATGLRANGRRATRATTRHTCSTPTAQTSSR
jgi:catechol 2,3-dioxygenase-like lactoylglutathione lyase family enzyme